MASTLKKTILVTGANGFIGRNLIEGLSRFEDYEVLRYDIDNDKKQLFVYLESADFIFHLAGINRPKEVGEYKKGNTDFTRRIISILEEIKKNTPIVFTSSIQAELKNPYGSSKKKAENILLRYGERRGADVFIFRLPNVFGKWCRPNYNSVVATFCYNISHGIEISISDPDKEVELVYIDDVVEGLLKTILMPQTDGNPYSCQVQRTFKINLRDLAERIIKIRDIRKNQIIPDLSDDFMRYLYATYLSHLEKNDFSRKIELKMDQRGYLAELLKSEKIGQIFISKSHPGVRRGNHYHNTKIEKFCVIKGKADIKLRQFFENHIVTYHVTGDNPEIVDIPPGYTHSIENTAQEELIVLFWADEVFNAQKPDTYQLEV